MRILNHINQAKAVTIALLTTLLVAMPVAASAAGTTVISNTAKTDWMVGDTARSQDSNTVLINVKPPVVDPIIDLFVFSSGAGTEQLPVADTSCINPPAGKAGLTEAWKNTPLDPAKLDRATAIHAGQPLIVAITDPASNNDPVARETMTITLTTNSGDKETINLIETDNDSGRFTGVIQTITMPPAPVQENCRLSVSPGETINLSTKNTSSGKPIGDNSVDVLIDPYGMAFDSSTGEIVAGVRITLINMATGQPAIVFGDDGQSRYPSTVITGQTVTDSSGNVYPFPPGDYRFPLVAPGNYRLLIEPPSPYLSPSQAPAEQIAALRRPDTGEAFTISGGSYGNVFTLNSPEPVRIDIPLDYPATPLLLTKTATVTTAGPGDSVLYRLQISSSDATRTTGIITLKDLIPTSMRLRENTLRYSRGAFTYTVDGTGRDLRVTLPALPAGATSVFTYALEVRPDAKPGDALNRAQLTDTRGGASSVADALVQIKRDQIADRMTIIGRVTDGGCMIDPRQAMGIAGARIMLEDGSYAVTDKDGRYHFEGVMPGLHVVQIDGNSLPLDRAPVDCARNTRSGRSAISRFVEGHGGTLKQVDFRVAASAARAANGTTELGKPTTISDPVAAGAERDWFAGQTAGIAWLFPEVDHNPRNKVVRVAIKHLANQTVRLSVNGKPVDPVAFEGARKSGDNSFAISLWRGIPLIDRANQFTADILDEKGTVVQHLTRPVHYGASPMKAEFLPAKSILHADGVHRPLIALRMTDRDGKPARNGMVGDFEVPAPYYPAVEADAQASRQLAGLERAKPVWRVIGDDGIAYVELEPTTASGSLSITLPFRDGEVTREQRVGVWLDPGQRPWTVVGFAAGTVGFNTLSGRMENLPTAGDKWLTDARLALYAKGRVKGKWLMTMAYDSDKKESEATFGGVIDPNAYYTIYADGSERRYDAASVRKLYLRLERPQFYALFGDYATGIDEPELARYVRSFNGLKSEYRSEQVAVTAFAADAPNSYRRDEIQGNGLTGPYALGSRDVKTNSERVTLEIRDRLQSNRIVKSTTLTRHIDYDIDYVAGTLRFREPILSRSSELDPQFIVVDYEVDGIAKREMNAGGRVSVKTKDKKLTVSATAIRDENESRKSLLGGADISYRPNENTEVRAEIAVSDGSNKSATTTAKDGTATAWLVEAEHHSAKYDLFAFAREQQGGFGVGQQNAGENGTRKVGAEGRLRLGHGLVLSGSAWNEDYLDSGERRRAGKALVEHQGESMDLRAGITMADDRLADGSHQQSSIVQLGATKRLFKNRLELDGQTEFALQGARDSVDFPDRHRINARFAVNTDVQLVAGYEIAKGDNISARTARFGFDLKPWAGGRLTATANGQNISEYGPRSFAAYGLSQSVMLGERWSVDASLDGNKTLGGIDPAKVLNDDHPVSSGGFLSNVGAITEDFTAVSTGATYRGNRWSWTGRVEYRDGDVSTRYGITSAVLRQLGEGRALGAALTWGKATGNDGARTEATSIAVSWAHRPSSSHFAWLNKLELREDKVKNAVLGDIAPAGGIFSLEGSARSRRLVNSLSINWSPSKQIDGEFLDRSEVALFVGTRYASDKYGQDDIKGWSNLIGLDVRFDLNDMIDIGGTASVRQGIGNRSRSFSLGPNVGISPMKNGWLSIGYNVVGFRDRDFEESRYTRAGPYVTMRIKFDQTSLAGLGLLKK